MTEECDRAGAVNRNGRRPCLTARELNGKVLGGHGLKAGLKEDASKEAFGTKEEGDRHGLHAG